MTLPSPAEFTAWGIGLSVGAGLLAYFAGSIRLAAYAGVAAAFCFMAAGIAHTYKEQGVTEQKQETDAVAARLKVAQATIANVQQDMDALQHAFESQELAMHQLVDLSAEYRDAIAKMKTNYAAAKAALDAKLALLQALMNQPAGTFDEDAHAADTILRDLADDRLRDAGQPAAAASSNQNGAGAHASAVH